MRRRLPSSRSHEDKPKCVLLLTFSIAALAIITAVFAVLRDAGLLARPVHPSQWSALTALCLFHQQPTMANAKARFFTSS
ncbi:hypothetical protein BSZ15_18500 [Bradyrhizobium canariense]|nr:hypothetical protein BSZ15_18500 [Bradyrhizobium canariense]